MATRKRRKKKKKLWAIPAGVAAVAVIALGGLVWHAVGSSGSKDDPSDTENAVTAADVVWQGKKYNYNDHLSNFLFIGVDNREKAETTKGQANAGQADALYLMSWDRVEGDVTVVSIPRDTMTQIEVFGPGGTSLGTVQDHVSLSYAYGDGDRESCELTVSAVKGLLYDLPIQGYCAINLDGLPVLTESVGGVNVTVPNDSLEEKYPEFKKGAQVTLNGENTETFVRYRDITVSQSALSRMERQQEYIRAFGEAAKQAFARNPGFVTKLYTSLDPYMVTNMGNDQFVKIMESVAGDDSSDNWTVPGEGVEGEHYDEYYVDDDALYEKVIETFYEEAE